MRAKSVPAQRARGGPGGRRSTQSGDGANLGLRGTCERTARTMNQGLGFPRVRGQRPRGGVHVHLPPGPAHRCSSSKLKQASATSALPGATYTERRGRPRASSRADNYGQKAAGLGRRCVQTRWIGHAAEGHGPWAGGLRRREEEAKSGVWNGNTRWADPGQPAL